MRRSGGTDRHGRALRWLIGFPVLLAFLAVHLVSCSLGADQGQSHPHQSAATTTDGDHGLSPSAPSDDCDHQRHDDPASETCLAVPRQSHPQAAGVFALPAVLAVQPPAIVDPQVGSLSPRSQGAPGEPRAGRDLLISVGVARI
ncbi:MAG: hypothetical protein ACT4NY_05010 [Pseudonocardiales bacterium]